MTAGRSDPAGAIHALDRHIIRRRAGQLRGTLPDGPEGIAHFRNLSRKSAVLARGLAQLRPTTLFDRLAEAAPHVDRARGRCILFTHALVCYRIVGPGDLRLERARVRPGAPARAEEGGRASGTRRLGFWQPIRIGLGPPPVRRTRRFEPSGPGRGHERALPLDAPLRCRTVAWAIRIGRCRPKAGNVAELCPVAVGAKRRIGQWRTVGRVLDAGA